MSETHELMNALRPVMYNWCLMGGAHLLGGLLHRKLANMPPRKPVNPGLMESSCRLALAPLNNALSDVRAALAPTPMPQVNTPLSDDDIEASVIALMTMATDGLNPDRPTPSDEALAGVLAAVYDYAAAGQRQFHALINK